MDFIQKKEFGDIAELRTEKFNPEISGENRKCIELEHIEQGTGRILGWVNSSNQKSTKNVFYTGDILFGKLRPYLKKFWLAEFNGVCSSEIWVLRPNPIVCSNNYLFNLIQTHEFIQAANVSSGSKMPRADWDFIIHYPLSIIHSLTEQTAIASLLSTWNKAIELNTKLLQAKQQRKKWLMQVLLTGKKRLPGFEGEWRKVKLGDIFNRVTSKNLEQNSTIVTVSAQRGLINQDEFFNKIVASESLANYFLIERGDFVYNKSYSNGYDWGAVKKLKEFEKAVVTTLYICFRIKTQLHSPDFLEFLFEAGQLDHGLMKIAHEGGRAHGLLNVTPGDFFNLEIVIPELREQLTIATTLTKAAEEIDLISISLEKMKEQKKGLMQVLLTGKKRLIKE